MASLSGLCSSSPSLKPKIPLLKATLNSTPFKTSLPFPTRTRLEPIQSVAREISTDLSKTNDKLPSRPEQGLIKDPAALWRRYVDWLYQHKELGLYLDVSRIGFNDDFVRDMEPRLQKAFKDMEELEKGAIANPDEGRMVGHYWLRNSSLAPNSFLKTQIELTLDAVCKFAEEVVSGKVSLVAMILLFLVCFNAWKYIVWAYFYIFWWLRRKFEAGEILHYLLHLQFCMHALVLKKLFEVMICLLFDFSVMLCTLMQIKPPSSPEGRFTQILSVGIGGSALGPQFVAEALAPDNPPLKVSKNPWHCLLIVTSCDVSLSYVIFLRLPGPISQKKCVSYDCISDTTFRSFHLYDVVWALNACSEKCFLHSTFCF